MGKVVNLKKEFIFIENFLINFFQASNLYTSKRHFVKQVINLLAHDKTLRMKYIFMVKVLSIYHLLLSTLYKRNRNPINKVNLILDFQVDV